MACKHQPGARAGPVPKSRGWLAFSFLAGILQRAVSSADANGLVASERHLGRFTWLLVTRDETLRLVTSESGKYSWPNFEY